MFLAGLLILQVAFAVGSNSPMCPKDVPVFNCLIDPCMGKKCPANPSARCVQNYCGGCGYDFYVGGEKVDCAEKGIVKSKRNTPRRFDCPEISCPSGRFINCLHVRGCQFCSCAKECPPKAPCPPDCETVKKDGCAADCKCKPAKGLPPVCPAGRVCNLYCKDGYEVDETGCVNTCKCKEVTCPLGPLCGLHCKDGYEVDENGCINSCKCKKPKTQVVPCHDGPLCLIYCRHGYQLDSRGCKTCKCKPFIPGGLRPAATGAPATKHDLIG